MPDVRFDHVAKRYGDVAVIDDMNLQIDDSEFMVLVGPSGCGKSTALRMVAGLEEISSGTISIGGRVVNDLASRDRDIAMVFQSYALYPHMTTRENLEFGLRVRKVAGPEIERLVADAAEILGLSQLLDRKPKQLSGGQRQRVAVGRAIVRKPGVFLFDEPLSNLDAKLRVQMRAEIKKLQQRLGTTTIYVTHDQVEAMTMGSRIAVMHGGRLQQVGTPLEIYDRPRNLFVAQFVGTPPMNFLRARIDPGGSRLVAPRFTIPAPAGLRSEAARSDGRGVLVGIRPEHVTEAGVSDPETATVSGEVELIEPLGDETIVTARLGEETLVYKREPRHPPEVGRTIELALRLDRLHLFDQETEERLGA